jgi:enoyl-CoA hydratase/carnithine racemase
MDESPLLLQREPPVTTVVFNRPQACNALNEALQHTLPTMLAQLRGRCRGLSQQATASAVSRAIAAEE